MSFLRTALGDFWSIGAIAPFSEYTIAHTIHLIQTHTHPKHIVELWWWMWWFTKQLKHNFPATQLDVFEINNAFVDTLSKLSSNTCTIIHDCASKIDTYIDNNSVDCIVCTLPFSILHPELTHSILHNTEKVLRPWWLFLILQYSCFLQKTFDSILSACRLHEKVHTFKNIPPAYIFAYHKKA